MKPERPSRRKPGAIQVTGGELKAGVPMWALRPGPVRAIRRVREDLWLWLLILTSNGLEDTPCTCGTETLAATWGCSDSKVKRALRSLRGTKGLLFQVTWRKGRRTRAARFATDPMKAEAHYKAIRYRLKRLRQENHLPDEWLTRGREALKEHTFRSKLLRERIKADLY